MPAIDLPELPAALAFARSGKNFVLTSHINCDGDGVAGCLALQTILRSLGKEARVILPDPPNLQYNFLAGWEGIETAAAQAPERKAEHLIVLDCPSLTRIGVIKEYVDEGTRVLVLDHHQDSQPFGHVNLTTTKASSSSELVYHLGAALGYQLTPAVAEQLYMGILFDTGGFRYALTTPVTLEVGAQLVRAGARLDFVADRLFNNQSLPVLKLLGRALESLQLYCGDRVAVVHLSHADLDGGIGHVDVVNYGLMVQSVEISVALKEQTPGQYRVSLRSRERIDVRAIAAVFDGGGHTRAAGCRLEGSTDKVRAQLLAEIAKHL
ncbi:MAG: bifunctional oligoribonuclease/PAP phosphatase NrnA [Candidatus Handelsmanbacteria bacterium]|nr:bifunctional oligoribonuclease/PAP phosphatase NrnA [Candidatus Handelsmanbacteria bacterium]